ncbi:MAG: TetR/AcrR family transcriptional regulator [Limnohabitans sp.]
MDALNQLLKERSLGHLTVENIADQAGLTRSAFLKRFGSKKQALFVLWARYCNRASDEMSRITAQLPTFNSLIEACEYMSLRLEAIQTEDFSANRAMHEDFQENLSVDPQTKKIFLGCVGMLKKAQEQFLDESSCTESGAFAAAQLLVTINYNYVLKAMPGLPVDVQKRHRMIGEIVALALAR